MYESHFGFTAAPFSLNPDPAFFFGSKGHSNALSYLKFGVYQGEGFVVVTGDIGAGKTTLVRTLLEELDKQDIVAAQIVSTQLEAGDLLRSVALAFGIAPKNLSKAELIATIEAFLTLLVTERKRALLIVDEAQNLNREAVEELRMLSNFQLGSQALLQSFLVGQPELRVLLTSKAMEQFRQRVIASCHLGPMDRAETQAYIEHRLQQVGWHGHPAFDETAFDRIYHWTSGIPRRVNLVCNRLLLGAYLGSQAHIDASAVDATGTEVRAEVGDAAPQRPAAPPAASRTDARGAPVAPPARMELIRTAAPPPPATAAVNYAGPLILVATSPDEDVELAMLVRALQSHKTVSPPLLRLRIGDAPEFALNAGFLEQIGVDAPVLHFALIGGGMPTDRIASVLQRFGVLLDEHRPTGVVVAGAGDVALACALAASRSGCPLVHVDAGRRGTAHLGRHEALNAVLIDRVAQLHYPSDNAAYLALIREGVDEAHVQFGGPMLVDAVHAALTGPANSRAALQQVGAPTALADGHRGYGVVILDAAIASGDHESVLELLQSVHEVSREAPLVWPMGPSVRDRLERLDLTAQVEHERMSVVAPIGFAALAALIQSASLVISDIPAMQMQATVLGVRCLAVGPHDTPSVKSAKALPASGDAAECIAAHLVQCLAALRARGPGAD